MFSREADILRATAGGGYTMQGVGQEPMSVLKTIREGGMVEMRKEGKVEPIPGPEIPDFFSDHAATAFSYLKALGFAPDAAWGDGAAGSGSDRGLQLGPMLELSSMKQINWSSGLQRLFQGMFRMIEVNQIRDAIYRGSIVGNATRRASRFALTLHPPDMGSMNPDEVDIAEDTLEPLPRTAAELFDGDYTVRFVWQNRIDPDDPAYVMSEVNKFSQALQSLETTLERLGVRDPESEVKRIEAEAERMPWLRQGMIAMLKAQFAAEGSVPTGAGGPGYVDPQQALLSGMDMMQTDDGSALDFDAGIEASGGVGVPYGGA
jgi:hypothetical protein